MRSWWRPWTSCAARWRNSRSAEILRSDCWPRGGGGGERRRGGEGGSARGGGGGGGRGSPAGGGAGSTGGRAPGSDLRARGAVRFRRAAARRAAGAQVGRGTMRARQHIEGHHGNL